MNPKDKAALDAIVEEIKDFEAELASDDAASKVKDTEYVREQLELLFDQICDLSQYKRKYKVGRAKWLETDRAVVQAWQAVLSAVEALAAWAATAGEGTRHHFIAARMLLFLMHGLTHCEALPGDLEQSKVSRERIRLQMDFNHRLDEALLLHLRGVWEGSDRKDIFAWAMTHMGCTKHDGESNDGDHAIRTDFNRTMIRALSPAELWDIPGMSGKKTWVPAEGDEPIYEHFKGATGWAWGEGDKKDGKRPIIRQTLFSDGPLRTDDQFCIVKGDEEEWLRGPRFARSLQFVLDVRQFLHPWLVRERQRLAGQVGELPAELRNMVAGELGAKESPDVHPYLSHLDLSAAYAPFPAWETKDGETKTCEECGEAAGMGTDIKQLTCPAASVYIWNRGLRAFHTFHPKSKNSMAMCTHGPTCNGHHGDDTHEIKRGEQVEEHILGIVRTRCGADATMSSVGLDGRPALKQLTRLQRGTPAPPLKMYGLEPSDVEAEVRATGGCLSLGQAMRHGLAETDMPCFEEDGTCRASTMMKPPWAWSRNEDEENLCKKSLMMSQADDWDTGDYDEDSDYESE